MALVVEGKDSSTITRFIFVGFSRTICKGSGFGRSRPTMMRLASVRANFWRI